MSEKITASAALAVGNFRHAFGLELTTPEVSGTLKEEGGFWSVPDADGAPKTLLSAWDAKEAKANIPTVVGSVSPVEDFWAIVHAASQTNRKVLLGAFKGLVAQIDAFLAEGNAYLEKASDCIAALRSGSAERGMVNEFNAFLASLRERVAAEMTLNGTESSLRAIWARLLEKRETMGVIVASEPSAVETTMTSEKAAQFYALHVEVASKPGLQVEDDDSDDEDIMDMD